MTPPPDCRPQRAAQLRKKQRRRKLIKGGGAGYGCRSAPGRGRRGPLRISVRQHCFGGSGLGVAGRIAGRGRERGKVPGGSLWGDAGPNPSPSTPSAGLGLECEPCEPCELAAAGQAVDQPSTRGLWPPRPAARRLRPLATQGRRQAARGRRTLYAVGFGSLSWQPRVRGPCGRRRRHTTTPLTHGGAAGSGLGAGHNGAQGDRARQCGGGGCSLIPRTLTKERNYAGKPRLVTWFCLWGIECVVGFCHF